MEGAYKEVLRKEMSILEHICITTARSILTYKQDIQATKTPLLRICYTFTVLKLFFPVFLIHFLATFDP